MHLLLESVEDIMGELIDLKEIRKQFEAKEQENEIEELYSQLDGLMERLEESDPLEFFGLSHTSDTDSNNFVLSPSVSALYNAYYTLISEDREDLAKLVSEIIKMV